MTDVSFASGAPRAMTMATNDVPIVMARVIYL